MGRFNLSIKTVSKGIVAASALTAISIMANYFYEITMEKAVSDAFQRGQVTAMLDLVEANGGDEKVAQNRKVLNQLDAMKGTSAIGYYIVDLAHQRHQVFKNRITNEYPNSLYRYDPEEQDRLVFDAVNEMSDGDLIEYLQFKLDRYKGKSYPFIDNLSVDDYFDRKIRMKTNFSDDDIRVFEQCIVKLSKKSVDTVSSIVYRNDSGGCKKLFYPVMKDYDYKVKRAA